ncbi:MAG TPA: saccharopine dehydrogenase NADP-binding domain-containing protein [Terriglobales bacterium]|nr:saccharopine dehydrogenase NADP-binding domain-containing protein [Terriglobales bacterium]
MSSRLPVVVFGAYGHTGRFVVDELARRGIPSVLAGRDAAKLRIMSEARSGGESRVALVDEPASVDKALSGCRAVINCAGPFIDTAAPIVEAAIRAHIPYFDVAAEQKAVFDLFERFARPAEKAGIVVLPALGFYGGLADLVTTVTMGEWTNTDEVVIAVGLDGWHPTLGTRRTGCRNQGPRFVFTEGKLVSRDPEADTDWAYPAPLGSQPVVRLGLSETIIIPRHLRTSEIRFLLNLAPLRDIEDPSTPPPVAVDERGRSSQVFLVDVVVQKGSEKRRTIVRGRDIYAVTAPIVVEAVERVTHNLTTKVGVLAAGQAFDARDFLNQFRSCYPGLEIFEP